MVQIATKLRDSSKFLKKFTRKVTRNTLHCIEIFQIDCK